MKNEILYIQEDMRIEEIKDKEQQKRIYALYDLPLKELIERYSNSQSYGEEGKVLNNDYYDVPYVIRDLLKLPQLSEVNDSIESIKKAIENLEAKFRNHRHETGKTFSAKPEY